MKKNAGRDVTTDALMARIGEEEEKCEMRNVK